MTKHTQRPWHAKDLIHPNNIQIWAKDCFIAEVICPPMMEEYNVPEREECEANGRLIIAAPNFLKGLCKTINFLDALPRYPSPFLNVAQSLRDELQELIDQVSG
jgi:hypothetical protein